MNDQQLKEMMDKLKGQYDQLPQKTSSSHIMAQIEKEKRPRWGRFFHRWQAVAMIVLALGLGSVLTVNQLGNFSSEAPSDSSGDEPEIALMPDAESGQSEEEFNIFNEAPEINEFETDEPEMDSREAASNDNEEAGEAAGAENESEVIESSERFEETIMVEGMDEQILLKEVQSPELNFTTRVNEQYVVEQFTAEEGQTLQFFTNFSGEPATTPFFTVIEEQIDAASPEELEASLRERYEAAGWTEREDGSPLSSHETELTFAAELSFEMEGATLETAIIEHGGAYYRLAAEINISGDGRERVFRDIGVLLKYAEFE
ncbi:hypothetical protein M3212_20015 [Alkalihalobacillus oceani]|uniref:hypothetical protein n=1 Tax=Halalkalibacter oceani TaxID=1653776 RepID=UPI00203AA764|nr:hypothetical protein [Halalkalibacter oceani]MCM3763016.1 hypothetical protein [Halalkalibacter oceani]